MAPKDFEVDDLVWAKMKGYPMWPAKIAEPKDPKSPSAKKAQHFVYFFGTHDNAWISDENISPHSDELLKNSENYKKKPAALQKAIEEIQQESKKPVSPKSKQQPTKNPKRPASKPCPASKKLIKKRKVSEKATPDSPQEKEQAPTGCEESQPHSIGDNPTKEEKSSPKKAELENGLKITSDAEDKEPNYKKTKKTGPKKTPTARKRKSLKKVKVEPKEEVVSSAEDVNTDVLVANEVKIAIIPPLKEEKFSPREGQSKTILNRTIFSRPPTPKLDLLTPAARLLEKNIHPTSKRIGFLGLGMIGRGMVKNLLNSGHTVTIWNRTPERCLDFVDAGASIAVTPSDVVVACDIIMCCVSNPIAAKELVFGNCGVVRGLCESIHGKGYVEMTSIDPTTSKEIASAVSENGGRYLEAPVIGSRQLSADGELVVVAAGDKKLFHECESCFQATSKNSYYVSCDVGVASKMNLIQSMLTGSVVASLAEAMALLEKADLSSQQFFRILQDSPMNSSYLLDKCDSMRRNEYVPNTQLKHQQKNLMLALAVGQQIQHPLCMAASATNIFKRAGLKQYSEHDVAAVQIGAKIKS